MIRNARTQKQDAAARLPISLTYSVHLVTAVFQSESDKTRRHTAHIDRHTGAKYCTCRGFSHGHCWHTDALLETALAIGLVATTKAPLTVRESEPVEVIVDPEASVVIDTTSYSLYNPRTFVTVTSPFQVLETSVEGDYFAALNWARRTCSEHLLRFPRTVTHDSRLGSKIKEVQS